MKRPTCCGCRQSGPEIPPWTSERLEPPWLNPAVRRSGPSTLGVATVCLARTSAVDANAAERSAPRRKTTRGSELPCDGDTAPYIGTVIPPIEWGSADADPRILQSAPVARNREPILAVLRRFLPPEGTVIEVASGTGEHAVYFGAAFPRLVWQPSDVAPANLASIAAWIDASKLPNVRAPLSLDLDQAPAAPQATQRYAAGFCSNLVHIAPWHVCSHLMAFMGGHLALGAPLITYGPYKVNGEHTSDSNAAFEQWLHSRSPEYGVRDMADVVAEANRFGLSHEEAVPMPANNFCLIFRKTG